MEATLVDDDQHGSVLGLQLAEDLAESGLAVGQPPVEGFLTGGGERGGVVFALADVQAEVDVDAADIDHVGHPSVLFTRPCHGTDRHIHITKSLPTCERPVVMPLISGLSVPSEPVTRPPGHPFDKGR